MKLSLLWLFEHINADWKSVDVQKLVAEFNQKTAEIENFYEVNIDVSSYTFVKIKTISDHIAAYSTEWNKDIILPIRTDVQQGLIYLVKKDHDKHVWAKSTDLGGAKEYMLPAYSLDEKELAGSWKQSFESHDWIIEVDNKSINHRPDLWSHRGIAREIAAILNMPLKPLNEFLVSYQTQDYKVSASIQETGSFAVSVADPALCRRFAGILINDIAYQSSLLNIAQRLIRVDSKVISAIVDITNYVMFDIGQPLHAFDAEKISSKTLDVRLAKNKEKITLLDGETVQLTPQDMVVADNKQPLAVAGVMGGDSSAVTNNTKSIFLESANFDPAMIRKTALFIKRRTEASARFEKSLDPHLNVMGILRFLSILKANNFKANPSGPIISIVGAVNPPALIMVAHTFIERYLGVSLTAEFVVNTLQKLDFKVVVEGDMYQVTVPTFRATKDISLPEDIVEEVGRFFGYSHLPTQLPRRFMIPFSLREIDRIRMIKQLVAYGLHMHEVYNYALYDENFLRMIEWHPGHHAIAVVNPVSENWRILVDSLIPGLLKNVYDNSSEYEQLRFFEWGRTWHLENDTVKERKKLAAILVNKLSGRMNFYTAKDYIATIFTALNMSVEWEQSDTEKLSPWFDPCQTATITYRRARIGELGKINSSFLNKLMIGEGYAFEVDGDILLEHHEKQKKFVAPSKYPVVERDISMLIKYSVTIAQLSSVIHSVDPRIISVELRDMFEKSDWKDQRSVTFRFLISDHEKTMSKEEVEEIVKKATDELIKQGAVIR